MGLHLTTVRSQPEPKLSVGHLTNSITQALLDPDSLIGILSDFVKGYSVLKISSLGCIAFEVWSQEEKLLDEVYTASVSLGKDRDERNGIVSLDEFKISGKWEERQGLGSTRGLGVTFSLFQEREKACTIQYGATTCS